MEELRNKIPETYKKARIIAIVGAAIGAGIGAYIDSVKGNYICTGLGAGIGYAIGIMIAFLAKGTIPFKFLFSVENKLYSGLGLASLIFAVLGIVVFIQTQQIIFLFGIVFFGLGGIYLLKRRL